MQNYNPTPNGLKPVTTPGAAPQKPATDLRAKYQLAPLQPGVQKIASLVRGKDTSSMEEITEIINSDHGVTQRLISIASPRPAARIGAPVQMATSRLGINRVIVVMVGDLLVQAVTEAFETMLSITLETEDASAMSLAEHGFLTGSVYFTGKTNGRVTLALSPHLSLLLAARLLGGNLDDEYPPEAINDAIGELVNIVTGNLQSRLCDAGLPSEVGLPEVTYQSTLPKETVPGGSNDHFYFRCGTHTLTVSLSIDPSPQTAPRAPLTRGT